MLKNKTRLNKNIQNFSLNFGPQQYTRLVNWLKPNKTYLQARPYFDRLDYVSMKGKISCLKKSKPTTRKKKRKGIFPLKKPSFKNV